MRNLILAALVVILLAACGFVRGNKSGPIISDISTSGKTLVISDCLGTSLTFSAKVSSQSKITSVLLWYRVGSETSFESLPMTGQGETYRVIVEGKDLQNKGYGDFEFYITAEDGDGNKSKSPVDKSVQFLPCVSH